MHWRKLSRVCHPDKFLTSIQVKDLCNMPIPKAEFVLIGSKCLSDLAFGYGTTAYLAVTHIPVTHLPVTHLPVALQPSIHLEPPSTNGSTSPDNQYPLTQPQSPMIQPKSKYICFLPIFPFRNFSCAIHRSIVSFKLHFIPKTILISAQLSTPIILKILGETCSEHSY